MGQLRVLGEPGGRLLGRPPPDQPLTPVSDGRVGSSQSPARTQGLNEEQIACLRRCADGNTLRFEALELVDAIVAAGYAQKSMMGVVTLTPEGQVYLATVLYRSRATRRSG